MILEGSRLHYGDAAWWCARTTRDLALLLGDQLYALGLSRLAALGDLDAVAELADVISLVAQVACRRPTTSSPTRSGRPARLRSAGARARSSRRGQGARPRRGRPVGAAALALRRRLRASRAGLLLVTFVARLLGTAYRRSSV